MITRTSLILSHLIPSKCIVYITLKNLTNTPFWKVRVRCDRLNGVFGSFFHVIQIIYLDSTTWDRVRKVLIIILYLH